jgi:UDP-N-acetylmuramoyl-L-alanyl-D-glutamate--2,6-diaminopimelate ligase
MKNLIQNLKLKRRAISTLAALHLYGNPSRDMKIVGVTGTNGKTTTATLLYEIALSLGKNAGFIGTGGVYINGKEFVMDRKIPTTPDPLGLSKIFTAMKKDNIKYVFMEVSSHAMDQGRVSGINFTGGIFTNLTHDHLDYHKTLENYFEAKKKFFKILPENAFAISNSDDEHGRLMLEGINANKHTYGFSGGENFHGEIFKLDFGGLEARFNGSNIKSNLLGKFNAYNLLAVWSACNLLGFDLEKVNKILEDIAPPVGRFQHFTHNDITVVVDYAHTPDAIEKVLLTAREIKGEGGRLISVFGCGGDRDPLKRRIMGKLGATLSDMAIFTSDNPRNEDPDKIIQDMKTDLSMNEIQKSKFIIDRKEAIEESVKLAEKGDIILCAGKGHETYQEIRGVKHHFNDMEEYRKILK